MTISLSSTARDLVRSGLFGKDFDSYVAEITDALTLRFGAEITSNIVASEQGVMLIDMMAFALSTASWYGDRQADDTTLQDARVRAAAVSIARQLGYKPRPAVPPAIEITMTLGFPAPARLTIEKGRKLNGPNGLIYETTAETIFDVGEVGPKTFTAREGETTEEVFVSDGLPEQQFLLTVPEGRSIADGTTETTVADILWVESALLTYDQTDQYEVQFGLNPPRLRFGDGVAGNIPPNDAEIRIKFFATSGPNGAVAANTVTVFSTPLVAGGIQIVATLTHDEASTPGSPRESIESIKINAPLVFQTAGRSVTKTDLTGIVNSFSDPTWGRVAIGRATTARGVDQDAEALTIISLIETSCPLSLQHGTVVGTGFQVGELVTGGTSGTAGTVVATTGTEISLFGVVGSFTLGETLTGGTSASTAALNVILTSDIVTRLRTYWEEALASNCQANVVVAQILAEDGVGRYVTAPVGLARALETYLDGLVTGDGIGESTVKFKVTDGSVNLLAVDMTAAVRVTSSFATTILRQQVKDSVLQALESYLLARPYGDSIYISDAYNLIDSIEGVDSVDLAISNQATRLDSFGNLVIEEFEVITLGVSPVVTVQ